MSRVTIRLAGPSVVVWLSRQYPPGAREARLEGFVVYGDPRVTPSTGELELVVVALGGANDHKLNAAIDVGGLPTVIELTIARLRAAEPGLLGRLTHLAVEVER